VGFEVRVPNAIGGTLMVVNEAVALPFRLNRYGSAAPIKAETEAIQTVLLGNRHG
jgi:hypothetical protein